MAELALILTCSKLAYQACLKIIELKHDMDTIASPEFRESAYSLQDAIYIYLGQLQTYDQYVQTHPELEKVKVDHMNDWINRDAALINETHSVILYVLGKTKEKNILKRAFDAHSKEPLIRLEECRNKVYESISNMACLVTFTKFDQDMVDNKENTVFNSIKDPEAKAFWIHTFGPKKFKVDIDAFTDSYMEFLTVTYGWNRENAPLEKYVLQKIIKNVIDTSAGQEDVISLIEFNAFTLRFKPLAKSFVKVS
jgi:hypothetical protein